MPTTLLLKAFLQPVSHSFQIRFCFFKADNEAFSGVRQARHLAMQNLRLQCTALGLVISNSETRTHTHSL